MRLFIFITAILCVSCSFAKQPDASLLEGAQMTALYSEEDSLVYERIRSEFPSGQVTMHQVSEWFLGTPYVASTLEGPQEVLTVNLREMDCTTFVEYVTAICLTLSGEDTGWTAFLSNLRNFRYRNGEVKDYSSRFHYLSEALDRHQREGLLENLAESYPGALSRKDIVSFMSEHTSAYPALSDTALVENIRRHEAEISSSIILKYIPRDSVSDIELPDGTIVAFMTDIKGLDVTHTGIVHKMEDGSTRMIHASTVSGQVEITQTDLAGYMATYQKKSPGILAYIPKFSDR